MKRKAVRIGFVAACLIAALLPSAGCADAGGGAATRPSSPADRAQADPWNYGPKVTPPGKSPGPSPSSSDRDSLQRDLNNVFNP